MSNQATDNRRGCYSSLCSPDGDTSCFRCCPPIRPQHYDHLDYRRFLTREFIDNTQAFKARPPVEKIITGFTCWGLGFLDNRVSRVGCLLHPARNDKKDLRDLTGYGDKCRRELCLEAKQFQKLPSPLAIRLLNLSKELDSFAYSSPKTNPVFLLLHWSPFVIQTLFDEAPELNRHGFRKSWSFLIEELDARPDGLFVHLFLKSLTLKDIGNIDFLQHYKRFRQYINVRLQPVFSPAPVNQPFVHQLNLSREEMGFLKSGLGWTRMDFDQAREVLTAARRLGTDFIMDFK